MVEHNKDILELIHQCLVHNESAQRRLFEILAPKIKKICMRYAGNEEDAKDDFQECIIQVFSNLTNYSKLRGEFFAWSYKISRNTICARLRKQKVKWDELRNEDQSGMYDLPNVENHLHVEQILSYIQQMPIGYRTVFNLSVFEQCNHKKISELLGITESSSRSQLSRAKVWLKEKIEESKQIAYEKAII